MNYQPIPLIHNYCNRWCERCPLGHRCSVNMSEEDFEAYMKSLEEGCSDDEEMEKDASQLGTDISIDVPEPTEGELKKWRRENEEIRAGVDKDQSVKLAHECGECIDLLCNRFRQVFGDKKADSTEGLSFYQVQKLEGEKHRLQNYFDILAWYRYWLEVKTRRAIQGLMEGELEDDDPIQNDWNGSAKVAMIGAGHCQKAAEGLLQSAPVLEDESLLLLKNLHKYLQLMDETFPRADEFIRPGFDTLGVTENLGL